MKIAALVKHVFYRVVVIRLSNLNMKKLFCLNVILLLCSGCQSPKISTPLVEITPAQTQTGIPTPDGIVITPYDYPEIKRQKVIMPE